MINATIKEVRVYRGSAVIRRSATVRLTAGLNELVVGGLSPRADPDSLRLFFPAGVVGRDVQIVSGASQATSDETAQQIDELQSRIETLKTMERLWIDNGSFVNRDAYTPDAVAAYLESLPARLSALREERRRLEKELREKQAQKETLKARDAFSRVRLILESPDDREVAFSLEYADTSAGWIATYEIHAAADAAQLQVINRARITQQTGEDWQDVRVTLYTGNPTARQEIPELQKVSLRFPQESALPVFASAMMGAGATGAPMMGMAALAPAPAPRLAVEEAQETEDETMTGYLLPGTRTVPSGATGTVADLQTITVPAELRVVCVPKLDSSAFLAAIIKTADWPLKPADAKIYLDENYCGETRVDPDMTAETFTLSLGRDERVGLSRETIRQKTEEVMFKGLKRVSAEYAIRVTNRTEKPLEIKVLDQLPVSEEKQIVVDCASTDGAAVDEETGKLTWLLTVAGKATEELRFAYTISHPKDKTIRFVRSGEQTGWWFCPSCGAKATGRFCPTCGRPR